MYLTLRITLAVGILAYFIIIIALVKRKRLSLRYALIWFVLGIVFTLLDAFPGPVTSLVKAMGFETIANALSVMMLFIVFITLIAMTGIISRQAEKIRKLTQSLGLMEKRIRDLENKEE